MKLSRSLPFMLWRLLSGRDAKNFSASAQALNNAKDIAYRVLETGDDPLLACQDLAQLRDELPKISDDIMNVFVGIASESDEFPLGPERQYWSSTALELKDKEAAVYRERVRHEVTDALRRLLAALNGND